MRLPTVVAEKTVLKADWSCHVSMLTTDIRSQGKAEFVSKYTYSN